MREVGIRFGRAGHLAATITLPDSQAEVGLVLPSAGLLHRVGPHRMHVRLARQAAARGLAAVRFDLPGIGDSLHSPGRGTYAAQELQAAQAAMDLLEQESGASRFVAAGLCSGADLACLAAGHDARVAGLFLMEPHYYPGRWSPALRALRRLREYGPRGAIARLLQLVRDQPLPAMHQPADPTRSRPAAREFAASLATLLERGAHLHLVYAGSSMGRLDLERHRRQVFAQLVNSPRFRVDLLPESDHLFTPITEMRKLESLFLGLLERVTSATAKPGVAGPAGAAATAPAPERTAQPLALARCGNEEVNRAAAALRPRASR